MACIVDEDDETALGQKQVTFRCWEYVGHRMLEIHEREPGL
jgi:hypothetical protein